MSDKEVLGRKSKEVDQAKEELHEGCVVGLIHKGRIVEAIGVVGYGDQRISLTMGTLFFKDEEEKARCKKKENLKGKVRKTWLNLKSEQVPAHGQNIREGDKESDFKRLTALLTKIDGVKKC